MFLMKLLPRKIFLDSSGSTRPKCFRTISGLESRPMTWTSSRFCITSSDFHIHWEAGSIEVARVTFCRMSKIHDISKYVKEPFKFPQPTACPHLLDPFGIKESTLNHIIIKHQPSPSFHTTFHLQTPLSYLITTKTRKRQTASISLQELLEICREQGTPLGLVIDLVGALGHGCVGSDHSVGLGVSCHRKHRIYEVSENRMLKDVK